MLRFFLRVFLTLLLLVVGRLFGPAARGARFGTPSDGAGGSGAGPRGSGQSGRSARRGHAGGVPPLDRSDVVDVPFTEIPPPSGSGPDPAPGPVGGS